MEVSECRYRGRVIGWLYVAEDGFLRYQKDVFNGEEKPWWPEIPNG